MRAHSYPGPARLLGGCYWPRIVALLCLGLFPAYAKSDVAAVRGVPFSRSYSLEDIGRVPRGSRLGFDRFGRLAVIHETIYTVLNDSSWLNLTDESSTDRIPVANVVQAADGRSYYGARGSWGYAETGPDGRLHPTSLVPANPPSWIATASFLQVASTKDGVYFTSWNGVVYRDFKKQKNLVFEVPRISQAFQVGNRIYISAYEKPLRYIDLESETLKPASGTTLDDVVVEQSTPLDETRSLVTLVDGRLLIYDGHSVSPWLAPEKTPIKGHVSVLQQIVDGRIAIAINGQGLLLFSKEGQLLMALTTSQYHNISTIANREPGVLWIATENTIEKILYSSPLSTFGQRLGLPITWPIITSWNERLYVASEGKLYKAEAGNRAEPTRFNLCEKQPPGGAWAMAAWGSRMLIGSGSGLYSAEPDGNYHPLPSVGNLAQLVMYDENHCYLIGREAIALLEWRNGRWEEAAQRIPGVGNPAIVHRVKESVWIEMGGDGVARLWVNHGKLQVDVIRNESWTKGSWVNIGSVGELIVLSARMDEPRRFFDQKTGNWCSAPDLAKLLERSPYWIARPQGDENGVIWACHNEGLVRFAPKDGDYEMDVNSFDLVNDRYPVVRVLPQNEIWISAARALYHVERDWIAPTARPPRPILVSMADSQRNQELLDTRSPHDVRPRLAYGQNNVSFRFFSGTDAWRRSPAYEYRLNENEPWTALDGSLLSFRGLHEGIYQLQVRIAGMPRPGDSTSIVGFEIRPPWHRTKPAYLFFGSLSVIILYGVTRWTNYLERRRSRRLERVVTERTRQLETTMGKLGDETRKAATLEERDRLANEIHDSVQQGLTGAILQLDTTLKMAAIGDDVRSRLNVVRNMVSYARQEVQHAVWDMESPLLEGTNLVNALRNLMTFVEAGSVAIDVTVSGEPRPLGRAINHNLLRVAQEATTNAFRHANATRIDIRLTYRMENVSLEIIDDGIGFNPDVVLKEKIGHLGLRGIKARVKKLHGQLTIESNQGRGTLIRVIVPLTSELETNHADLRKQS